MGKAIPSVFSPPGHRPGPTPGGDAAGQGGCLLPRGLGEGTTLQRSKEGASLVVQWLRVHLPVQGTWVRALVREDPTCHGATKLMCHNY